MGRDTDTTKIIDGFLRALVITGMMGSLVVAPNAVQLGNMALKRLDRRKRARQLVVYMQQRGLVDYKKLVDGRLRVYITQEGRERANSAEFRYLCIPRPKEWDGKWRLVMFDIAETHRQSRVALTLKLKNLGFYPLQKSAWAYPYPCEAQIELIRRVYEIKKRAIVIAEITHISQVNELRQHFKIDE